VSASASPTADSVWDAWSAARAQDAELTPEAFAERYGDDADDALSLLLTMAGVVREAPPPPLVDVLAGAAGPDGRPRFAGFRLDEGLGQGSSGMVFAATDLRGAEPRRVALKILNPLLAAAPERRAQILREAEIAGRLDHPGIVRVLDRGVERGYAWIAAELVDGRELDDAIDDDLPPRERSARALGLGLQLARALAHAHAAGVVHRDLKPANVHLDAGGRARILDFGLARADGTAFALSSTGEAVGTPLYMAPEQARGERDLGPRTDLYALGLMLLELGAGRRLVAEPNVLRSLGRIASGRFRPPRSLLAEVPRPLRDVVERCLERHPDDRYPNAEALLEDLEAARAGRELPWGAMPRSLRALRRAWRHPWRAMAAAGAAVGVVWLSWGWWSRPMPVWIGSFGDGKLVHVDGEERPRGHTPILLSLRPGEHPLLLHFNDPGPEGRPPHARFRTRIPVERGAASKHFFLLEPHAGVPTLAGYPTPSGDADFAWVEVATPEPALRLRIDDGEWIETGGACAFALPYGRHDVRIEADGMAPVDESFVIDGPELVLLCHDLHPPDAESVTIPIQGPADARVRRGTVAMEGLRLYYETDNFAPTDLSRPVHKAYLGPTESFEPGHVLFRVELPFAPSQLDLKLNDLECCVDGYLLLEMGASPEELLPIVAWRRENLPASIAEELGEELATLDNETLSDKDLVLRAADLERYRRLIEQLDGGKELWIRYRLGETVVGESVAYSCALRTNEMPTPGGEWKPAMEIVLTR
jgi:hypothetical protein